MALGALVLLAALAGLGEVLPVNGSGQDAVAALLPAPWATGRSADEAALTPLLRLATLVAVVVAQRRRLAVAVDEGVRAIARPAMFRTSAGAHDAATLAVATAASIAVSVVLGPLVEAWATVPSVVGFGLLLSGLALASTRLVTRRAAGPGAGVEAPSLGAAALVGVAHGLAVVPGASRIAVAIAVALWLGVQVTRALDLGLSLSISALAAAVIDGWRPTQGSGVDAGSIALGLLVAFLGATLGCAALRALADRGRLALLSLWLLPLGLATIAYARALPGATF